MEEDLFIEQSLDSSLLDWPPESDLSSEDHFVRGYIDIRGLTWEDACKTLKQEQNILLRVAGDLSAAEESLSNEEYSKLYGLDVGVAAAVVALSASNCAPFASCNGGAGHHEVHPCISFFCRKGRVASLVKAAKLARCGLTNGVSGFAVLYARDTAPLLLFAEKLIGMRSQLKPLSRPYSRRYKRAPKRNNGQLTLDLL